VEELSSLKWTIISSIAKTNNIDVLCLQETHTDNTASRFTIGGFDFVYYHLHPKHGRAMYVRSDIVDVFHHSTTTWCDIIKIGNKLPREHWNESNLLPVLRHRAIYIGDFNSRHTDWVYTHFNQDGGKLKSWASNNDLELIHHPKQKGTFQSARWQKDSSPDLCWVSSSCGCPQPASCTVLGDFPRNQHRPLVIHAGLTF